jgi:transcriptional regulator with XRE-family HTH domain
MYMSTPSEQAHGPFAVLGERLRDLRTRSKESVAEAAGAVEIGEDDLIKIEQGVERPSEEILMLLISHFGMKEDDAVRLWELAGYDASDDEDSPEAATTTRTITMAIALDPRVMYSDSVHVNGNKHGVVLSFLQPSAAGLPQLPVSRIGMSHSQAEKLAKLLQETLTILEQQQKPKQLPPTTEGGR